ncbi:type II restriction endonuclease [Brevibacillus ruminantium]|uniref:Type II restriction endonuclease n=1 Tax=Brevibacillus ruminantium TaxID=2950604 RepID=A0ABY4WD91_9BACL|nr:type II restriction endonuclease [Brevibacillus ruminantium]USG65130.1 type II restriction endonuclease [Brevibacillus ruminantium]
MQSNLDNAIETARKYGRFFCKFLSANDTGLTKAHQEGVLVSVEAWPFLFDEPGQKGENKESWIRIHWEDGIPPVESRGIWYGTGTRREYRITRFWKESPYNKAEHCGDLLILVEADKHEFYGFILSTDDDIEEFINFFSLSIVHTSAVYGLEKDDKPNKLDKLIKGYANDFSDEDDFPATIELALKAREFYFKLNKKEWSPDLALLHWIDIEYSLFKALEQAIYKPYIETAIGDVEKFIDIANSILNRRKSRAGKSLEHHADFIFREFDLPFDHPGKTEGNKKPDFLFPSNKYYARDDANSSLLTFLGAKTTCKDRWRQILNEANKIPVKHLLTLQQGITKNQLQEMKEENVVLVVPKPYHNMYPTEYRADLVDVSTFIGQLMEKYA